MADIDNNMYCNRELNTHAPPLTMYDMQDMHNNYYESYALLDQERSRKKARTVQYTPVLFGDLLLDLNKKKSRASKTTKLKILMDSGTSGTIISGKHIGPYKVLEFLPESGNVRIQKGPVSERVNIRRVTPFRE